MWFAAVLNLLMVGSFEIVCVLCGSAELCVWPLPHLEKPKKCGQAKCVPKRK